METMVARCPECGAPWTGRDTCRESCYQMEIWEFEYPEFIPEVHHLMVLSYHLQHPTLYSPEGLRGAVELLVDFLERGLSPQQVRQRARGPMDSGRRKFKIKGTPARHGAYDHPVSWSMTAPDVIAAGAERYGDSVKAWAKSILQALKASGVVT